MFAKDLTITRQALGIIMIAVGVLGAAGVLLADVLGAGRDSALGPLQMTGLVGGSFIIAVGVSLLFINPKDNIFLASSKSIDTPS